MAPGAPVTTPKGGALRAPPVGGVSGAPGAKIVDLWVPEKKCSCLYYFEVGGISGICVYPGSEYSQVLRKPLHPGPEYTHGPGPENPARSGVDKSSHADVIEASDLSLPGPPAAGWSHIRPPEDLRQTRRTKSGPKLTGPSARSFWDRTLVCPTEVWSAGHLTSPLLFPGPPF